MDLNSNGWWRPLALGILALNLAVAAIVGGTLWQARHQYGQRAAVTVESQSQILERDISGLLARLDVMLLAAADEYASHRGAPAAEQGDFTGILQRYAAYVPDILGLRLVGPDGDMLFAAKEVVNQKVNIRDRRYFQTVRDNPAAGLVIDGPMLGRASNRQVMVFARRISDAQGRFLGEVHAAMTAEQVAKSFSALALGEQGSVALWTPDKRFLMRYTRARGLEVGGDVKPSQQLADLLDRRVRAMPYQAASGLDGVRRIFYLRQVDQHDLYVILSMSEEEAYAPWWEQVRLALFLQGGFVGLTLLCGGWIYRARRQRLRLERDRDQAQAEVQATLDRLSQVVETAAEGIIGLDAKGLVIFANRAAADMLGWPQAGDMLGISSHQAFGHRLSDGLACTQGLCAVRLTLRDATVRRVHDEYFCGRTEKPIPVSYAVSPLGLADGGQGAVVVFHDITLRKMAEAEIKSLLSYQQAVLNNTPVGIAIFSMDRVLKQANQAFLSLFAQPGEDLVGCHAGRLYADSSISQRVEEHAYPVVRAGGRYSEDLPMRAADGSPLWIRLTGQMVRPDVEEMGVVWAFEDITQRKKLELEIQRSNADLEQFAYVTSHDLRQPLRMITSYLGLIERRMGSAMTEDVREFFAFASDGARRLDRLILDLLEYSRVGREVDLEQPVCLADVLLEVRQNLAVAITEAKAELSMVADLPVVRGDFGSLVRLFQNLVGNAVKYRAPDQPCRVEIGCRERGGEWLLWVRDNGIGMEPDQSERAFGLFQRLVGPGQYEGTGIGLAICKKIVKQHGGHIWIETGLGQGSTFFLTLQKMD